MQNWEFRLKTFRFIRVHALNSQFKILNSKKFGILPQAIGCDFQLIDP